MPSGECDLNMSGPINWLSQVASVSKFGLLSIPQRRGSVAAAVIGIAGVVAVLVGVLSMGVGFEKAMTASGSPDAAIVLRSGADTEMVSGFLRESTRIIADAPGVARTDTGPLASAELFVIINLPKRSTGTDANVPMRGVEPAALQVRDKLKLVDGRMFEWGKNEAVAGIGAANEFTGVELGGKLRVGQRDWPIVGIFSAGGGTAESEIWTDASVLQAAYKRGDTFQSVQVKLASPGAFQEFKDALTTDPRLNVKVLRQAEYYAEQSTAVTKLITTLGFLIAFLMAVGAVFGALNTMYSSVSARTREIATLRALGFGSGGRRIRDDRVAGAGCARRRHRCRARLLHVQRPPDRHDELAKLQPGNLRLRRNARPARARDCVVHPHRSDWRPLPRHPRRPPPHRRRPPRALIGPSYCPSLIEATLAETASRAPATETLTCHFAPGSSTGR